MIGYVVVDEDGSNHGPFPSVERAIYCAQCINEDALICDIVEVNYFDEF